MYGPITVRDKGAETAGEQKQTAGAMEEALAKAREAEKRNARKKKSGRPGLPGLEKRQLVFFPSWADGL